MKQYRKKKRSSSFAETIISLVILSVFFIWSSGGIHSQLSKGILIFDIFVVAIFIFSLIKKKMKEKMRRKKYLTSSLYKIDRMSGEEFETYLEAHFRNLGYKVMLTQKSNDYGADLILEKSGERVAVQAKRYNGKVGNAAIQEVSGAMRYYKCQNGMVITNSFYTKNAINLAKECDIELWNRYDLEKNFKII